VRLHPLSIPYRILENGVGILGGAVLIAVTSGSGGNTLLAVGSMLTFGALFLGIAGLWQYLYFRRFEYEETPDTFDIRSGVLSRREREIPYGRIQNVDVAQNALQRALSIAELRLETAGGSETEAQLSYVSRAEADRLQELISRRKRGDAGEDAEGVDATAAGEELFRLESRELAILGLVSADLRVLGLLTVLASAFAPAVVEGAPPGIELLAMLGPVLAVVVLAGLWVVSGVRSVLRYYGFRLSRHGDELRYERGLLQRFNGTIPLEKVQTVTLRENVLARRLGYATLVIETAGYAAGGSAQVESAVPIGERDRVLALARSVEPVGELDFQRPPKRARTRYAFRYALVLLGLTALAFGVERFTSLEFAWYLPLALLVVVPVAAHLAWANRGYALDEDYVVTRNGFWRRQTMIVPYDRVQTVLSSQTIFQRRRQLGSVIVDTASGVGITSGDAAAVDVDAEDADRLRETVHSRLQSALSIG
jgi:putative membrane protein